MVLKTVRESGINESESLIRVKRWMRISNSSRIGLSDTPRQTRTLTAQQRIYIGSDGANAYSEFSFGAGEASIIHLVTDVEALPDGSLLLIDETENGLHPASRPTIGRAFISAADRKRLQVIFTTHSDYAPRAPLPSE